MMELILVKVAFVIMLLFSVVMMVVFGSIVWCYYIEYPIESMREKEEKKDG